MVQYFVNEEYVERTDHKLSEGRKVLRGALEGGTKESTNHRNGFEARYVECFVETYLILGSFGLFLYFHSSRRLMYISEKLQNPRKIFPVRTKFQAFAVVVH